MIELDTVSEHRKRHEVQSQARRTLRRVAGLEVRVRAEDMCKDRSNRCIISAVIYNRIRRQLSSLHPT
jgi:hypothetical protein